VYTAQTRAKAREKWEEDFLGDLQASAAFRGRIKPSLGNGNEHIRFRNGSRFGLEASTEKAGHGPTLDEAYIDEAFSQPDFRMEQAFNPAMITRKNKQLGWISTAGWLGGSPYLADKAALGRKDALEGRQHGRAFFDWSAPEDADPGDESVWWRCMPALGRTIAVEAIRAEYEKARDGGKLNEFRRAYLNQWVPKDAPDEWLVIPQAWWKAAVLTDAARPPQSVFAVDTTPDRAFSSVAMAGGRPDGRVQLEVADHGPGTAWVVSRAAELNDRWAPACWVVDPRAGAGLFIGELEDAGLTVVQPKAADIGYACAGFYDAVRDGMVRHDNATEVRKALAGAATRKIGDQWAFDRRSHSVDLSPLMAFVLARWGWERHAGDGYDVRRSVGFDVAELVRLWRMGVYGPGDVERCWARGLIDDAGLVLLAEAGIPVPAGAR
jgi:hypothetical protein